MTKTRTLTVKTPTDLLAMVPYVMGFHPEDSIVLLTVGKATDQFHARVDIPDDPDDISEVVAMLVDAVEKNAVRGVAVVAYTDDESLAATVTSRLQERLEEYGVTIVHAVRADGRRWYSLTGCVEPCCPAEGTPYDLSSHPITAQAVLDGQVTLGSRRELEDSLVGDDPAAIAAVEEAVDRHMDRFHAAARHPLGPPAPEAARDHLVQEGQWVQARIRRFLEDGRCVDDDDAGRLLVSMVPIEIRDVAWAEMQRRNARSHVDLWRDLLRRSPFDLMAAPAALLGFAAWLSGDGALAWCAVERCQEAEPDYRLAGLLTHALAGAVPPSAWQPPSSADLTLFAS